MSELNWESRLKLLGLWPQWTLRPEFARTADAAEENIRAGEVVALPEPVPVADASAKADSQGVIADGRESIMQMEWEELTRTICQCRQCGLSQTRTQAVPGVGDRQADWLIVGEAPGADEDASGEPFVGQAGKLLDSMLAAIGLARGNGVYIANVLKCRPPGNRNPQEDEIVACEPYLARQIELIRPRIILAVGKFAAQWLLDSDKPVGALRGKIHFFNEIPVVVTYHPAYLLRSPTEKARAWEDLCLAQDALKQTNPPLREDNR